MTLKLRFHSVCSSTSVTLPSMPLVCCVVVTCTSPIYVIVSRPSNTQAYTQFLSTDAVSQAAVPQRLL